MCYGADACFRVLMMLSRVGAHQSIYCDSCVN